MNTPTPQRHRAYLVGPRPVQARWTGLEKLAIGLVAATVGLVGLELYETHAGPAQMVQGVVSDHGMRLVGKVVLSTTTVQITDGPMKGREVSLTSEDSGLDVGAPVVTWVREGQITGELRADFMRADYTRTKPNTP